MKRILISISSTVGFMAEGQTLSKIALATGVRTPLTTDKTYTALCYGGDSVLYGAHRDEIGTIHQTTGVFTPISNVDGIVDNIMYKDADEIWFTIGNSMVLLETNANTATGTCVMDTNALASITITNDGYYADGIAPTITITGGGGTGAEATAVLTEGLVTSIVVDEAGESYETTPTATFSAGDPGEYTYVKQDL